MAKRGSKFRPGFAERVAQGTKAKLGLLSKMGGAKKSTQRRPSSHAMTAAIQQLRTSASWLTRQQAGGMTRRVRELESLAREARKGPLEQRLNASERFEAKLSAAQQRLGGYELGRRNEAWEAQWSSAVRGLQGELERIKAGIFRRAYNEEWLTSEARLKHGASYTEFLQQLFGEQELGKLYERVLSEQQGAVQQAQEWLADPDAIPVEAEEERYRMVMAGIGIAMA